MGSKHEQTDNTLKYKVSGKLLQNIGTIKSVQKHLLYFKTMYKYISYQCPYKIQSKFRIYIIFSTKMVEIETSIVLCSIQNKILHILLVSKQKTKYNNIEVHNYIIHSNNNHKIIILFNKCHDTNKLCDYPSIMPGRSEGLFLLSENYM